MIRVNTPLLDGNERKYLLECIDTEWISSEGPFVKKFESDMANYVGRKFGVAVSNGSAALDIAIKALGIGAGDEVILPTFTIISPVQSVVFAGATPVLVDSDPFTWNMDVTQIEAKITPKTKAIVVVHIYGLPTDMNPIVELCKKYKLFLVEDAAEMHGQTYHGSKCGSFGDISTFSFYPNKHITTGEGGMCLTDNEDLAKKCQKLRNLAFEPQGPRFVHHELGWNYRMTNMQAALGVAQLENLDKHIELKREIGNTYNVGFEKLEGFQLPLKRTTFAENIYWVYGLVASSKEIKDKMIEKLTSNQIETRPFFWCMHEQPVFKKMGLFVNESYPFAENLARLGFYIPSGLGIKKSEIQTIINVINNG